MVDDTGVGARIATARKLAGLTQHELAERAHVSYSLIAKVEAGHKPATPTLITAVAAALRLHSTDLTGQPYRDETRAVDEAHEAVADIRRVMMLYRHPDAFEVEPRPVEELRRRVDYMQTLRSTARMLRLSQMLPGLLEKLQVAAHSYTGHDQEVVFGLLADAYDAVDQVVYKLGHLDLSCIASDRYIWAARQSGDRLRAEYITDMFDAWQLMVTGSYGAAHRVLSRSIERFEPVGGESQRDELAVYGSLHLRAALSSARGAPIGQGSAGTVDAHLDEAAEVARQLSVDQDAYHLVFGPSNVQIYGVATAVELGDGTTAVERARHTRLPRSLSRERRAHHLIDTARGWLMHGDQERSLRCLLQARKVAPQQTRVHPMTRETLRALSSAEARRRDSLAEMARWAGIRS